VRGHGVFGRQQMKVLVPIKRVNLSMSLKSILALEAALRQKEAGKISGIVVITVDGKAGMNVLHEAFIRGAREAILIETEENFDAVNLSGILEKIAEKENLQLISNNIASNTPRYLNANAILHTPPPSIKIIPLTDLKLDLKPNLNNLKTENLTFPKKRLGIRVNSVEELIQNLKNSSQTFTAAKMVFAGGRGFKSREQFQQLARLAEKMGATVGATGAAVAAGYISHEYQIGQTAKVVAPDFYFAFGLSGAMQHVVGMQNSKIIIAINRDSDAPIFKIADYGLVGEIDQILPVLEQGLIALLDKP
jgi:hypothetical protein